jgi:SAM-dependent methyltransferase
MNTIPARKPYQGSVQILQFNWQSYIGTAMGVGAAMLALPFLHPIWRVALLLAAAPATFWLASSLIVSHYIYDRFPLYDLNWISRILPRAPRKWINIHCGFDETSGLLASIFPEAVSQVVDIYDSQVMTEASIRLARRLKHCAIPSVAARYDALAFKAGSFDAAFSIFAAHELRRHDQRVRLFSEVARILVSGGNLILIEHSRDLWNFAAFGPGFLHFFSQRAWQKAALDAGLTMRSEFSMTPFVRVYNLRKVT